MSDKKTILKNDAIFDVVLNCPKIACMTFWHFTYKVYRVKCFRANAMGFLRKNKRMRMRCTFFYFGGDGKRRKGKD